MVFANFYEQAKPLPHKNFAPNFNRFLRKSFSVQGSEVEKFLLRKKFRVVVYSTPIFRTIGENGIFARFRFSKKSENYALAFVFASRDQTQLLFHLVGRDFVH